MSRERRHGESAPSVLGAELAQRVAEGGEELLTLLVEVDLPEPRVRLRRDRRGGRRPVRPMGFRAESAEERETRERVVGEARAHLEEILDEPPRWLAAAHTFIVKVEPARVLEVAAGKHVRSVRLSRERAPDGGA